MANQVITEFNATGYAGQFAYSGATGSFSTNGLKKLMSLSGGRDGYGTFEVYSMGDTDFSYNPHFSDISKASDLISIMTGAVAAVQEELDAQ